MLNKSEAIELGTLSAADLERRRAQAAQVRDVHWGQRMTSTIMYGHIDGPEHWANHMALLRDIQKETGGFTEFVPLGFIHYKTRLYLENDNVRPGPTQLEHIRMHAIARLMLNGWIDNIQASWVKLGPELMQSLLSSGVNDLGGTLMNESIARAGRRNTLYGAVETFAAQPLIAKGCA